MPLTETRYGPFEVPDQKGDLIGSFLSRYGEWAWDEVVFVASNLEPGARVLDVGAYLGTFGIGLGLRQHLASVCFVEANPDVAGYLHENVRRLKRQPAQVVPALVFAGGEAPRGGRIDAANWGALSFASDAAGERFARPPDSVATLSELREFYGPFDLIKLDVEGMERELIESDADFLRSGACRLWMECNEGEASLDLVDALLRLDLEVYYFAFPSHNPDNYRNDTNPIFPSAYEAGLLAGRHLSPRLEPSLQEHGCVLRPIASRKDLRNALWRTPRWGLREWDAKPASEVVALAGRMLLGQDYERFLEQGPDGKGLKGARALSDHVQLLEARLAAHEAALEEDYAGDERRAIRDLIEREAQLRARLDTVERDGRKHEDDAVACRRVIEERDAQLRTSEARLSEARHAVGERSYQVSVLMPRIKVAENAAADAQARLYLASEQMKRDRDKWIASEQSLRAALASGEEQIRHLAGVLHAHEEEARKPRGFYQKIWRPFFKKVRKSVRINRKGRRGGQDA